LVPAKALIEVVAEKLIRGGLKTPSKTQLRRCGSPWSMSGGHKPSPGHFVHTPMNAALFVALRLAFWRDPRF